MNRSDVVVVSCKVVCPLLVLNDHLMSKDSKNLGSKQRLKFVSCEYHQGFCDFEFLIPTTKSFLSLGGFKKNEGKTSLHAMPMPLFFIVIAYRTEQRK